MLSKPPLGDSQAWDLQAHGIIDKSACWNLALLARYRRTNWEMELNTLQGSRANGREESVRDTVEAKYTYLTQDL